MVEAVERSAALVAWRPGRDGEAAGALAGMGAALPGMGRFTVADGTTLARVGPHQMLALREGVDAGLMEALAPLQAHAGVIDLSDSRVGVVASGAGVREWLAGLLPLDLHDDVFPVGACAQTLMAHLTVLVLRTGPDRYEIQCGRSFAWSFFRAVGGGHGSELF